MPLLPKDDTLLDDLAEHAKLLVAAAGVLGKSKPPGAKADDAANTAGLATQAHAIALRIIDSLRNTFLTPLDRDDLFALATRLEAVMSAIEAAVFCKAFADPEPAGAGVEGLAAKSVELLASAVEDLKDEKVRDQVRARCAAVRELERDGVRELRKSWRAAALGGPPADAGKSLKTSESLAALLAASSRAAEAILMALLDS